MSEDVKKKLIIIISVSLVLIVLFFFINKYIENKASIPKTKVLNDENKYFTIQRTINDYLESKDDFNAPSFTAKKIYYKEKDNLEYYFINGYTITYEQTNGYNKDVNYLLITYSGTYELKEINTSNIETYAEDYDDYKALSSNEILPIIEYTEKTKLEAYLSHFINMLNYDNSQAYELLTEKSHNKYNSYYSFQNNISDFKTISSQVIEYKKDGNTYTIKDSNNNTIKIIEESLMNYKLEI